MVRLVNRKTGEHEGMITWKMKCKWTPNDRKTEAEMERRYTENTKEKGVQKKHEIEN